MTHEFTIRVEVKGNVTEGEVLAWLSFQCEATSSLSINNPLVDEDSDAEIVNVEIE